MSISSNVYRPQYSRRTARESAFISYSKEKKLEGILCISKYTNFPDRVMCFYRQTLRHWCPSAWVYCKSFQRIGKSGDKRHLSITSMAKIQASLNHGGIMQDNITWDARCTADAPTIKIKRRWTEFGGSAPARYYAFRPRDGKRQHRR